MRADMEAEPPFARFDHPASKTWFVFKPLRDEDPTDAGYLVGARRFLDARGLMDASEFEELLDERAAG